MKSSFFDRMTRMPLRPLQVRLWLILLIGTGVVWATSTAQAQAPAWWTNRNVIVTNAMPNDFAIVNQGQVKWLVTQAAEEFATNGLSSAAITALVASFSPTNNYLPVNRGQLKNVSQPFYDCLYGLGLTNCYPAGANQPYPWSNSTNGACDYAMANIGQAKYLFSFDLLSVVFSPDDLDNDGLPDAWEAQHGIHGHGFGDALGDPDGDGAGNLEEYVRGSDPNVADPMGSTGVAATLRFNYDDDNRLTEAFQDTRGLAGFRLTAGGNVKEQRTTSAQ